MQKKIYELQNIENNISLIMKSIYFKIVDTKEYKKSDYQFKDVKKISISKTSYIVLGILIVVTILSII